MIAELSSAIGKGSFGELMVTVVTVRFRVPNENRMRTDLELALRASELSYLRLTLLRSVLADIVWEMPSFLI